MRIDSKTIEDLIPTPMWCALKDRYEYMVETDDIDDIGFDKYLEYLFQYPFDLLDKYLEWEGIIGYTEIIKRFILNFHDFLK